MGAVGEQLVFMMLIVKMRLLFRRGFVLGYIKNKYFYTMFCIVLLMGIQNVWAQEDQLIRLSLEELMDIEVTLASRKEQRFFDTAAAIFVLTQDDIYRSGVTSIPEVLRLVPGMQVAHVDANKWAISARGFNGRFAQKLLVLIDGRTVYSPIFSGVFWDIQDLMLEDVERIEVIRGPGATLWGTNAVNGIINIITKRAYDTQGFYVRGGGGTEERGFGAVRFGAPLHENATFRIYGKYFNRDAFVDAFGKKQADDWYQYRTGLRYDWQPSPQNTFTAQAGLYRGRAGQTFSIPVLTGDVLERVFDEDTDLSGAHVLAQWDHTFSPSSKMSLQTYYDRNRRMDSGLFIFYETYDVDFQHQFVIGKKQNVVWGVGYRTNRDTTHGMTKIAFDPLSHTTRQLSAFVQNEIDLVTDRLNLTVGLKVEHNAFTGFEYQPNTRFMWTPSKQHAFWGAVSRAVRTPARADSDVMINFKAFRFKDFDPESVLGGVPVLTQLVGNKQFESEKLIAYELGYRVQPTPNIFLDAATFFNVYTDLRGGRIGPVTFYSNPSFFENKIIIDNMKDGETWGFELVFDWHCWEDRARLRTVYSHLDIDLKLKQGVDPTNTTIEVGSPKNQAYVQLSLTPHQKILLDGTLRFVGRVPDHMDDTEFPISNLLPTVDIERYTELDLRLGVYVMPSVEVAIVGQNLLHAHHQETEDFFLGSFTTQNQRGVYGTLAWSF